jgi:hypothetical protein
MSRSPREIERAFRRARWQDFVLDLRRSWAVWALLITAVGGLAYYRATPQTVVATIQGTAVGAHRPASEDDSARMRIAVRLDANRTVNVPVPRGTPYLAGAQIEIEVIRRDWWPRAVTYRFIRYAE